MSKYTATNMNIGIVDIIDGTQVKSDILVCLSQTSDLGICKVFLGAPEFLTSCQGDHVFFDPRSEASVIILPTR